jgi:hypothetical protein
MSEKKSRLAEVPITDWARRLGEQRHVRDERVVWTGKSEAEATARSNAASLERWQAIVECIRRLSDAYNAGAKRVCLSVVERSGPPAVTVAWNGEGTPYLTATLEDTVICVRGRDAGGAVHATEVRLRPDRDNDATAAYLMQSWMQRL